MAANTLGILIEGLDQPLGAIARDFQTAAGQVFYAAIAWPESNGEQVPRFKGFHR